MIETFQHLSSVYPVGTNIFWCHSPFGGHANSPFPPWSVATGRREALNGKNIFQCRRHLMPLLRWSHSPLWGNSPLVGNHECTRMMPFRLPESAEFSARLISTAMFCQAAFHDWGTSGLGTKAGAVQKSEEQTAANEEIECSWRRNRM